MYLLGHINNLYNTTFWALVLKGGMDATQAEEKLKVCVVKGLLQLLFSRLNHCRKLWQRTRMRSCSLNSTSIIITSQTCSGKAAHSSVMYNSFAILAH